MGSQPTQSTQVQNTSNQSKSEPHPYIQGDLLKQIEQLRAWQERNPNAPGYYPGGTVAPQSERTRSAETTGWQYAANALNNNPGRNAALAQISDTIGGKYLDPGLNTAYQGWLDASFRPQAEHFRDILAPSIDAKFGAAGRTAGGAHFDTTMRGVQDLQRAQADAAAKAGLGLYQGERDKQYQAMGLLPGFQAMDYQNIGTLLGLGNSADAYAQRLRDDASAKYMHEATAQPDFLTGMAQRYLSMFPGGQTHGSGTTTASATSGGGGGAGQYIGPAMSLAGSALMFF
jgi:hypothetical protein